MTNTTIIRNNEWDVHINLDGIDDKTLGGIIREIVTGNFHWENFCKCDDLWVDDGRIALTCIFIHEPSKHIEFQILPAMEKFCLFLTNGRGAEFIRDYEMAEIYEGNLSKMALRRIILKMIEAVEKPNPGTDIWTEVKKSLLN